MGMKIKELSNRVGFKFRKPIQDYEFGPQVKIDFHQCLSVDYGRLYRVDHSNCETNYTRVVDQIPLDVEKIIDEFYTEKCSSVRWFFDVLVTEVGIPRFGVGEIIREVNRNAINLEFKIPNIYFIYTISLYSSLTLREYSVLSK